MLTLLKKFPIKHWCKKPVINAFEYINGVFGFPQGTSDAFVGSYPKIMNWKTKTTYLFERLVGDGISAVGSMVEMFEGISLKGTLNFLTAVTTVGTAGLATPIVTLANIAATAAGATIAS
ncbi:hypothetical protein ABWK42_21205 [Bacillus sp. JJ927]|uniref:hypothetical protein n=1 Tax=Bacillus sp. JJ927 TaxID=3122976 RepID=UPI00339268E2